MSNIATGAGERKACSQEPETVAYVGLASGLDPERHRIILQHWFGWQPVGVVAAPFVLDGNGKTEPLKSRPNHHGGEARNAELRQAE